VQHKTDLAGLIIPVRVHAELGGFRPGQSQSSRLHCALRFGNPCSGLVKLIIVNFFIIDEREQLGVDQKGVLSFLLVLI